MKNVYVAGCCRTPIGSFGGSLSMVPATELGAVTVKESLRRAGLRPERVDEVYFGCVLTAGLGQNVARQVALKAGLPVTSTATTVGMVCGSGMKAVVDGVRAIRSGDANIVVAGGCENMSASPYLSPGVRWGARMADTTLVDGMIRDGLWDAFHDYHMGMTAENICERWRLTREQLDAFALASQEKAARAREEDRFREEIVPVEVKRKRETILFDRDEYLRTTTSEALGKLRPAFKPDGGMVTAGNASGINDGAAALVLASERAVREHGLSPLAKIIGWGQAGVDPAVMGIGPVDATRKALEKAAIPLEQVTLIEANEAFAAQSLAVAQELGFDMNKVNVNGGAIALGHPIGASGARIIVTLLHEMHRRSDANIGLATLCVGGGMGIATVFKKYYT